MEKLQADVLVNSLHKVKTPTKQIKDMLSQVIDDVKANGKSVNKGILNDLMTIYGNCKKLNERVDNLLEFPNITDNHKKETFELFDIKAVIDVNLMQCQKDLEKQNKKNKLNIYTDISEDFGYIYGNQNAISKVIGTLLRNAVRFTDNGEIKVSVNIVREKQISNRLKEDKIESIEKFVLISVKDTGVGIKESEQEYIFRNLSFGLYLSNKIIIMHSGMIWVESEPEKGATFSFVLPYKNQHIERRAGIDRRLVKDRRKNRVKIKIELEERFKMISDGNGETILIIDNNPGSLEYLKFLLEKKNYKTIQAYDAEEGLELLYENFEEYNNEYEKSIKMVIIELMMPNITGYTFCQRVRKRSEFNDLQIIILTSADEDMYDAYSLNMGANDCLTKPFSKEKILARVSALLNTQKYKIKLNKIESTAELAAWMSHELNNYNQVGMSVTERMQNQNSEELSIDTYQFMLKKIMVSFEKMREVVGIISQYGKFGIKLEKNPYNEIIKNAILSIKDGFLNGNDEKIKLINNISNNEKLLLHGDKGMLEIVFFNLIKNAYQSIKERTLESVKEKYSGIIRLYDLYSDKKLKIIVEDNGGGISSLNINDIFSRNYSTKAGGRGIGLFLARKVVRDHGGDLTVESKDGEWTRLIVSLPV